MMMIKYSQDTYNKYNPSSSDSNQEDTSFLWLYCL